MALLDDSYLPGAAGFHLRQRHAQPVRDPGRRPKKSKSHAGILSPLTKLAKGPRGIFGDIWEDWHDAEAAREREKEENRKQVLYLRLRDATSYTDWRAAASELDRLEGNDLWKQEDESAEYDYNLVQERLKQLDDARISCDVKRMLFLIRTSLTRGLGGMGDLRLYKHSHIGTKSLIERYIESAQKTVAALLEVSSKQPNGPDGRVLLDQLLQTRQSFGRSALLLSGGGTFGMNHIGVVKSLWEAQLLPRIISGASAGSIVAGVLCVKTDPEIPEILKELCVGDFGVFEKEGEEEGVLKKAARFLKYGSIFDVSNLVRVMQDLLGDLTFQEAYNRTRRILNITVSSEGLYELPRLLNYITAPNVIIWSAVTASCSVPFVFPATPLLAKDPKDGSERPWNPSPQRWIDGSVDNDLPMTRLAEMFNVNHFIVSQVNPHVVPFLRKEEDNVASQAYNSTTAFAAGPTWLNTMASLAKGEALHRLQVLAELGFFPNYCTKARSVLSQKYSGDITIFPEIPYSHFPKVLSNPTAEFMQQATLGGERATWPKLSRIQNHCAIELALDGAVRQLRARVAFSPSQVDLRQTLHGYIRPASSGSDRGRRRFSSRTRQKIPRLLGQESAPATADPERRSKFIFDVSQPPLILPKPSPLGCQSRATQGDMKIESPRPISPSFLKISSSDALSSSFGDDETTDDDDDDGASLSSTPGSPPSPLPPELWPTTRQLFPSASQPATPSIASLSFSSLSMTGPHHSRYPSNPNPLLSMSALQPTPNPHTRPSSPELRYKRLFHGRRDPSQSPAQSSPASEAPTPPLTRRPDSRRSSATFNQPPLLQLDISGTRGMMLRRRRSALFNEAGSSNPQAPLLNTN